MPDPLASTPDIPARTPDLVARIRDLRTVYVLQIEGSKSILNADKVMKLRVPYDPLNPENTQTVGVYTYSPDERSDNTAVTFLVSGMRESEALLDILRKEFNATIDYKGLMQTHTA